MRHKLLEYRHNYRIAREMLGMLNTITPTKKRKSLAMTRLNKTRNQLLDEIQRVRWLLWPFLGRPYIGLWSLDTPGGNVMVGTMLECVNYAEHHKISRDVWQELGSYKITKAKKYGNNG